MSGKNNVNPGRTKSPGAKSPGSPSDLKRKQGIIRTSRNRSASGPEATARKSVNANLRLRCRLR